VYVLIQCDRRYTKTTVITENYSLNDKNTLTGLKVYVSIPIRIRISNKKNRHGKTSSKNGFLILIT